VTTMLSTYYHRGEKNYEYLLRYNDSFPMKADVLSRLEATFAFVDNCNFRETARCWKKTDLFTVLVELDSALNVRKLSLDPNRVSEKLSEFYAQVDELYKAGEGTRTEKKSERVPEVFKYLKAATKATNDKYARLDRANVIGQLIESSGLHKSAVATAVRKSRRRTLS
jgi:hypothetical protein